MRIEFVCIYQVKSDQAYASDFTISSEGKMFLVKTYTKSFNFNKATILDYKTITNTRDHCFLYSSREEALGKAFEISVITNCKIVDTTRKA